MSYLPFIPASSPARYSLPEGACDCHFHIFEGEGTHPYATPRSYTPTPATLADHRQLCDTLGLDRAVLVHPSVYGRDHHSFEDALAKNSSWMRGVAVAYADLGLPVVVDHFGHADASMGLGNPGVANMLSLLRDGRIWVKLSGAYRVSRQRKHFSDVGGQPHPALLATLGVKLISPCQK